MIRELRTLVTLTEDPGLIPSTVLQLTVLLLQFQGIRHALLASMSPIHTHIHTYVLAKHSYTKSKNEQIFLKNTFSHCKFGAFFSTLHQFIMCPS